MTSEPKVMKQDGDTLYIGFDKGCAACACALLQHEARHSGWSSADFVGRCRRLYHVATPASWQQVSAALTDRHVSLAGLHSLLTFLGLSQPCSFLVQGL